MRSLPRTLLGVLTAAAVACGATFACNGYVPPPRPTLVGLSGSTLADPKAPLAIDFGKPIDPATLRLKVAYFDTDIEGDLPDETEPPGELRVLFSHDPDEGDRGGTVEVDPSGASVRVLPQGSFPVGPKLVLLVEGGLTATDGRVLVHRTRVPFSYLVTCGAGARAEHFQSGIYFLLLDVEEPLGTQIQLFGDIEIDPSTGVMTGQFTNADRNRDPARCPTPCGSSDACRLLPSPACVPPSTKAGTVDEHSDFLPNATPPTGYSSFIEGCTVDDDAGAGLVTAPASMIVESPPVTISGLTMTAFFAADANGTVRGTGSLAAEAVALSGNLIGPGKGTMTAVRVAPEEVPPGIPAPPRPEAADGGLDGGTQ
jgi:hypothetical protein